MLVMLTITLISNAKIQLNREYSYCILINNPVELLLHRIIMLRSLHHEPLFLIVKRLPDSFACYAVGAGYGIVDDRAKLSHIHSAL